MIEVMRHGPKVDQQVPQVFQMIAAINARFPTQTQTVGLWFVADDYAGFTPEGSPEYAILDTDEPKRPKIFVAIENRSPEQIAGTIAFEYARYLQTQLGMPDSKPWAKIFAQYMNGNPDSSNNGGPIADRYDEEIRRQSVN